MEPFRTIPLDNGLIIELYDQSNRYFGDYHRIKVDVRCDIPLVKRFFDGDDGNPELERARKLYGDTIRFERSLEKMGVAGADVDATRESLVENFVTSTVAYLEHPEFVKRYVARMLDSRKPAPMYQP